MSQDRYSDKHKIKILNGNDLEIEALGGEVSIDSNATNVDSSSINLICDEVVFTNSTDTTVFRVRALGLGGRFVVDAHDIDFEGNSFDVEAAGVNLKAGNGDLILNTPSIGSIFASSAEDISLIAEAAVQVTSATSSIGLTSTTGDITALADNNLILTANNNMSLSGNVFTLNTQNDITIDSKADIDIDADNDINIGSDDDINIIAGNRIWIDTGDNDIEINEDSDYVRITHIEQPSGSASWIKLGDDGVDLYNNLTNPKIRAFVNDGLFLVTGGSSANYSHVSTMVNTYAGTNADVLKLMIQGSGDATATNKFIRFTQGSTDYVDRDAGTEIGAICGDGLGGIDIPGYSFTGYHACLIDDNPELKEGLIVSSTGKIWMKKVSVSQATPKVRVSAIADDKNVFGVIGNVKPQSYEGYVKSNGKQDSEACISVNSIGEGRVWVTNINGNVECGDYITSSIIPGYGKRQDDDILRSCTVAKCTEEVNWEDVSEGIEHDGVMYKCYLVACTYHCG